MTGVSTAPMPLSATRAKRSLASAALLVMIGPGVMVMLADTDAGSVITAAQSGAKFRYAFILPQLVLIPALYLVQEMTVRLGLATGEGHGALIRRVFGSRWALLSAGTLFVACRRGARHRVRRCRGRRGPRRHSEMGLDERRGGRR